MRTPGRHRNIRRRARTGNALIEFSMFLPWLIFLFTAVFDFGFYAYALIGVENAARAGVLQTATNTATAANQSGACRVALDALRGLPNLGGTFTSDCSSEPVTVTASYCDGSTLCPGGAASADGGPASVVTVTYRMPPLFRFPLRPPVSITRTAQMRLGDTSE
jgi:Flp pilus assembly protein TadG